MDYQVSDQLEPSPAYVLEDQFGFILRRVNQRHTGIFADHIGAALTTTQFATLAKLSEMGSCTQNLLGRHTAMDAATIKGVVEPDPARADPNLARPQGPAPCAGQPDR